MLSKLYNILPISLQHIAISLYGYYWKHRRFGGIFSKELAAYKSREHYTVHEWYKETNARLQQILNHAVNHVPFYQEHYRSIHTDKVTSQNIHELLPLLTKQHLREFGKTTLLADKREKGGSFYASSGSTGTPVNILYSYAMHQRYSAAFESRIRHWAGLSNESKRGMIGGRRVLPDADNRGPFYRYNYAEKQVYFSAYHIAPQHIQSYVQAMRHYRLDYMTGYAVSNYLLAKMIKETGMKAPAMKAVITSSEQLTEEMRALLEEVYQCKVFDSYSGVECCGLITECEHGSLHISPDLGLIEVIKDNGEAAKPGETGRAICTGFLNFDQPLIRYDIGDYITLAQNQSCKCGRNMPVVAAIVGRSEDIITGPDGRKMVRFHGIFIDLPNVLEGQIIQENQTDYQINISTVNGITAQEKQTIIERMQSQLGEVNVSIHTMHTIPRGSNGKFKAVISKLAQE
jgi:phenylacetate-CoA ligase